RYARWCPLSDDNMYPVAAASARGREGQRAMAQQLTLRPAHPDDFAFCERTNYLEPMRATIEGLGLDEARHLANFANRWQVEQVRIVMMCGQVIGWLQTASTDDALFLAQLF